MATSEVYLSRLDKMIIRLIYRRRSRLTNQLLVLLGVEFPVETELGTGFRFSHSHGGLVVHPRTKIGRNVTCYHGVTIGRAHIWQPQPDGWPGITIEDEVILCAGAVVLGGHQGTTVGEGTVVGANSVLTESTGTWEVWAGSPARLVGKRT